jgi:hypothetical protein
LAEQQPDARGENRPSRVGPFSFLMFRPPRIHHCTSEPLRFFGRAAELALLDAAVGGGEASVVALVGPGGQGKTAIVQHWLERLLDGSDRPDGLFLWSFYRGKDADLCLRELYAYAAGLARAPDVSASYCVDHLLPILRRERWAIVLDGAEVAQYESGPWAGRFLHPELGRLLEEVAGEPIPGVVALTTRFELPTLQRRPHARLVSLAALDGDSARALLAALGVRGESAELDAVASAGGHHAKAVELLGTFLVRYRAGSAAHLADVPLPPRVEGGSDEEQCVARALFAFQQALPQEAQDVLALATAFREPPAPQRLLDYLASSPVRALLHETWGRAYVPFAERETEWLGERVRELIELRLLERVGRGGPATVIDAHPLVRRAFEDVLGPGGRRQSALARAGFLRGRPDRRRPETLDEAREAIELFHASCDAGLWNEADAAFVAMEGPKHRFLAPALERDLLLRFFPEGDWRRPPTWPGFGRWRSLAICFEMLGAFADALGAYRPADFALSGDALLALGRLRAVLDVPAVAAPWGPLWQAYRAHALCLAGRTHEASALARSLLPQDVYEWIHVFECLLRLGQLSAIDLRSVLFQPAGAGGHRWADLARRRMRADYLRQTSEDGGAHLGPEYEELLAEYDRAGLPLERALTRASYSAWLLAHGRAEDAGAVNEITLALARQCSLRVLEAGAWSVASEVARRRGDDVGAAEARFWEEKSRAECGYCGPCRP